MLSSKRIIAPERHENLRKLSEMMTKQKEGGLWVLKETAAKKAEEECGATQVKIFPL